MSVQREVELKSVVDNELAVRQRLERAGARLVFEGRLEDRIYDTVQRTLDDRDHVLRLRVYRPRGVGVAEAHLEWKGPTGYEHGYKVREELSTDMSDPAVLTTMLERLAFIVTRAIDRDIAQYALGDTTVRFERYPRMDTLVEIEGDPEGIERAITMSGLSRTGFTTERLMDFVKRYEARTGTRAAISDAELAGVIA